LEVCLGQKQIYLAEALTLRVINVIITILTYLLLAELLEKTTSQATTNVLLLNGAPLIMMCHAMCINETIPGAAKQFNQQVMQLLKYNFFKATRLVDRLCGE